MTMMSTGTTELLGSELEFPLARRCPDPQHTFPAPFEACAPAAPGFAAGSGLPVPWVLQQEG